MYIRKHTVTSESSCKQSLKCMQLSQIKWPVQLNDLFSIKLRSPQSFNDMQNYNLNNLYIYIYTCENVSFPLHLQVQAHFPALLWLFSCVRSLLTVAGGVNDTLLRPFTPLCSMTPRAETTPSLRSRAALECVCADNYCVIRKTSQKSTLLFRRDTWLWARRYFHVTDLKRHFYYCIVLFISFLFL